MLPEHKYITSRVAGPPEVVTRLQQAVEFDARSVGPLIKNTLLAIMGARNKGSKDIPHGGLLFLPAPIIWVEVGGGAPTGVLMFEDTEGDPVCQVFSGERILVSGWFTSDPTSETCQMWVNSEWPGKPNVEASHFAQALAIALGALVVINAPRGVRHTPIPAHKGQERERIRQGLGPSRPAYTVTLDTRSAAEGGPGRLGGSPKAFHFCRAHNRTLASGRDVKVRWCWKGDPSIGINPTPTYRIAA